MVKHVSIVSVIVPVSRNETFIRDCIRSLQKQTYPDFEIILSVDNNTTAQVRKILEVIQKNMSRPGLAIKIVESKKTGSAANRNFAVLKANPKSEYLAFTDSDCIVDKNWLSDLVALMQDCGDDVICVGGTTISPKNKLISVLVDEMSRSYLGGRYTAQHGSNGKHKATERPLEFAREVTSTPTCNSMYRLKAWKLEKQNEKLIIGQDGEMNIRLRKRGFRFLATSKARVLHDWIPSWKSFMRKMYVYGIATGRIFWMHKDVFKYRPYALFSLMAVLGGIVLIGLGFINIVAWKLLFLLVMLYLALIFIDGILTALRLRSLLGLGIVPLLFLQHVLYGFGVIVGLLRPAK
ncbi:glycosyltransferase [Candidatus Woesearchaeota archaeon]|nr:glycosyltransferase [Candidatus Woesearchaeota archaeon]